MVMSVSHWPRQVSHWELFKLNVWRGSLQTSRDLTGFILWGVVFAINGFLLGTIFYNQVGGSALGQDSTTTPPPPNPLLLLLLMDVPPDAPSACLLVSRPAPSSGP